MLSILVILAGLSPAAHAQSKIQALAYSSKGQVTGAFVGDGAGHWFELQTKARHTFTELQRDASTVLLRKSDGATVKLDLGANTVSIGSGSSWSKLYDVVTVSERGEAPRSGLEGDGLGLVAYARGDRGGYGGVFVQEAGSNRWFEFNQDGAGSFTEFARDEWSVYLRKSDGSAVALDLWLKKVKQAPPRSQAFASLYDITRAYSADAPSFRMILASDSQYPWTDIDNQGDDEDATKAKSRRLNEDHVKSMNQLATAFGNVRGAILNGDLTAFFHDWQADGYKEIYGRLAVPLYPGLGNHDYANNVDDTWENRAATSAVEYLRDAVKAVGIGTLDLQESESYKLPNLVKTMTGSLAYSFDVGRVHFVQLNNYPVYERSWSNFRSDRARRFAVNIKASLNWLENDLAQARNAGKALILNFHDAWDHWADGHGEGYAALRSRFQDILSRYQVSAVFVGHFHSLIGRHTSGYAGKSVDYGNVPLFFCGASSYSHYLLAEFGPQGLTVQAVDSSKAGEPFTSDKWKKGAAVTVPLIFDKPETPLAPPPKDGWITFFNEGGYVARYSLNYTVDGKAQSFGTGNLALGNKCRFEIPGNATSIQVKGEVKTGLVWDPWRDIFSKSFATPPRECFKSYGTTLNANWNNNCD